MGQERHYAIGGATECRVSQGASILNPSRFLRGLGPRAFCRAMRFFPPIRNTGVRVDRISDDWRHWGLRLPLDRKTRNYVGTHFGGTLYSAADPHLMLAWMHILGRDFVVWDKAATIRFRRPGRGTLRMAFDIQEEEVAEIRALSPGEKVDRSHALAWTDAAGDVVAEVDKVLHFRRRDKAPG